MEKETKEEVQEIVFKDTQKNENKKARGKIGIFLFFVGLALGGYGVYWYLYASSFEETENAYVNADQNAVTSQLYATVTELNVIDGQSVDSGFVAIKLDATDYLLALQKANFDLALAVRSYGVLKTSEKLGNDDLNSKQLQLDKIKNDFEIDNASYNAGILSKENWLTSKYQLEQAKIAVEAAKSSMITSAIRANAVDVYHHPDVLTAINAYKKAYYDLQRTEIKIPVAGKVAKRAVFIGQRVAPNQTLFSVIDINHSWVDVNLKESQLKDIKIGQKVKLVSDVNNKVYTGYVSAIGAGSGSSLSLLPAQNATGNWIKIVQRVPIRVNFESNSLMANGALPIGTSVRVTIDTKSVGDKVSDVGQKTAVFNIDGTELNNQIEKIIKDNVVWK